MIVVSENPHLSMAEQADILAGGRVYPLADVLREGPNVSIRPKNSDGIGSSILAGIGLGTMIWIVFVLSIAFGSR